jgi:hypothetical protein
MLIAAGDGASAHGGPVVVRLSLSTGKLVSSKAYSAEGAVVAFGWCIC